MLTYEDIVKAASVNKEAAAQGLKDWVMGFLKKDISRVPAQRIRHPFKAPHNDPYRVTSMKPLTQQFGY